MTVYDPKTGEEIAQTSAKPGEIGFVPWTGLAKLLKDELQDGEEFASFTSNARGIIYHVQQKSAKKK